jgi:cation:H+ antiporter
VEGASDLATRFGISTIIIGFTVVAFGTSLPELVVSMGAAVSNSADLALENVIGSNVVNIAFILALCSVFSPQIWRSTKKLVLQLALMFAATAILVVCALNVFISRMEGVLMPICFFVAFVIIWKSSTGTDDEVREHKSGYRDVIFTVVGLVGVIIGAEMVVLSAKEIAVLLGVSDFAIGVTIVAVGTSLPELVTSLVAVVKGEYAISVGNILGSNLFNILAVLGASAAILPIPIPNLINIVLLVLFTVAVLPLMTGREKITRAWGIVLLALYAGYIMHYITGGLEILLIDKYVGYIMHSIIGVI